jgi:hypothetical protein
MAPKAAQAAAQKKAKRQKKLLLVLAIPAALAMYFAVHTFMTLGSKPAPVSATPAASTTPVSSIPSPTSTGTPVVAVTPGIAVLPASTLNSFISLGRKDPFHDHGPHTNADTSSGGKHPGSGKGGKPGSGPTAPLTGAVIELNGKKLALALGASFGHAPGLDGVWLFRLGHVTSRSAEISLVGTNQHFTLHVGRPLTLAQDGGWQYTLLLEPAGSAGPMTVQTTTTTSG